jgi:hypothetical protein
VEFNRVILAISYDNGNAGSVQLKTELNNRNWQFQSACLWGDGVLEDKFQFVKLNANLDTDKKLIEIFQLIDFQR